MSFDLRTQFKLEHRSRYLVEAEIVGEIGGRSRAGTKEGPRPELVLSTGRDAIRVLAGREQVIWKLGSGPAPDVLKLRPAGVDEHSFIRYVCDFSDGGQAFLIGRSSGPPYSTRLSVTLSGSEPAAVWRVIVCDPDGSVVASLNSIDSEVPFKPWSICTWTDAEVAIALRSSGGPQENRHPGGILLWEWRTGGTRWFWRSPSRELRLPSCIARSEDGGIYVADSGLHRVFALSPQEQIVWQYGIAGSPGGQDGLLRLPEHCSPTLRGCLITDTLNNRVIEVGHDGKIVLAIGGRDSELLRQPKSACYDRDGNLIIADTGHGRVVQISADGSTRISGGPAR